MAANYMAVLPTVRFDNASGTNIMGSITGTTVANGTGVMFTMNFINLSDLMMYSPLGEYPLLALDLLQYAYHMALQLYHIHQLAVPADGNSTGTMAHLDPRGRGELHACEIQAPQTCQAGDLFGKHGDIISTSWNVA